MKSPVTVLAICLVVSFTTVHAQAPQFINYQGRLDSSGVPLNGPRSITYTIYADPGPSAAELWQEIQTDTVTGGVFSVQLGKVTPFPFTLFTNQGERWLGIKIGAAAEVTPRFQLTSVAYSLRATNADVAATASAVLANTVTSASIVDGTLQRDDVTPAFKAPFADTADFARSSIFTGMAPGFKAPFSDTADFARSTGLMGFTRRTQPFPLTGTTTFTTVAAVAVTIPAPGYIHVSARGTISLDGTTGRNFVIALIDSVSGGIPPTDTFSEVGSGSFASTAITLMDITAQSVYYEPAGTHVFFFKAMPDAPSAGAGQQVLYPSIAATYLPAAGGSLESRSGVSPPGAPQR